MKISIDFVKKTLLSLILIASLALENSRAQDILPKNYHDNLADVVEKLLPTVVSIAAIQKQKSQKVDLSFLDDLPNSEAFSDVKERIQNNNR